jgi:hypothetical protein
VRRPDPIEREDSTSFVNDIFPIFLAEERDNEPPRLAQFRGTGFRLADDLLVTCWHCVVDEPERGGFAIARIHEGDRRMYPLVDVARDSNGSDLATARIYWEPEQALPPSQLILATKGMVSGADVWTYGYPLTTEMREPEGPKFVLNGRYLEGYVTRTFWYDHPSLGTLPAYELDMPAPEGLSGAPLVNVREKNTVVGVIYGAARSRAHRRVLARRPRDGGENARGAADLLIRASLRYEHARRPARSNDRRRQSRRSP